MTYFELKDKSDQYFRKIVGINKLVFNEILNILLAHKKLISYAVSLKNKNLIIDVTEVETKRPKYNQKDWFSGKKWMHTVKFQTIINAHTNEILNIFPDIGKNHDFKNFKNSKLKFLSETAILADKGYQGLQKNSW